jgi:hypothetical protein
MFIGASSASLWKMCRRKAFASLHCGLSTPNYNLISGSAFHEGVAHGLATQDWLTAQGNALAKYDDSTEHIPMPEFDVEWQSNRELVEAMVKCYAENVGKALPGLTVIQPECQFDIALPGSQHNCIMQHWAELVDGKWVEKWNLETTPEDFRNHVRRAIGGPSPTAILEKRVYSPHLTSDLNCPCWQPHHLIGTTDAVCRWNRELWLMEHKTTAIGGEQFWSQFRLDLQPTVYLYAINKTLGLPVNGMIVDALFKPSQRQVAQWNSRRKNTEHQSEKDYLKYSHEIFLRTPAQLAAIEQDLLETCHEWERAVVEGRFPLSNTRTTCVAYNRMCEYSESCLDDTPLVVLQGMMEELGVTV